MPTTYSYEQGRRLGTAILKFLESHSQNRRLAPDQDEGINVAIQCLALVFDAKPTDAKDVDSGEQIPDLMEVYNAAAGEIGIAKESEVEEGSRASAEGFKTEGNRKMKAGDFDGAIEEYTKAIDVNPKSEVYYCNRAAAFTNKEKFHEALDDCKRAIAINEDYAKAFSRMGLIYSKLEFFAESESCYKVAIELEPENEGYKKNLDIVAKKAKEQVSQQAQQAGFQQGLAQQGAGMGMDEGMMNAYQQFAGNPEFQKMATDVMSDPNMQGMVNEFMSAKGITPDPAMGEAANPMEKMAQAFAGSQQQGVSMDELYKLGRDFATHMKNTNPELINNMQSAMGSQFANMGMGGPMPGSNEEEPEK